MITQIKARGKTRSDLYFDGEYAYSLENSLIKKHVSQDEEIDSDLLLEQVYDAEFSTALERSYTFLEQRMRSEKEVRTRLRRYGYADRICDDVVEKLKEQRFLNDELFSQLWSEKKLKSHSLGAVKQQLRQKGIDREFIDAIESEEDQELIKCRAVAQKYYMKTGIEKWEARRKAAQALGRRGYSWTIIRKALLMFDEQIDELEFYEENE